MITLSSTLNVSGTYTLTDDILWTGSTGAAIRATGPATIDLNGHRIIGVGGANNTSSGIAATNESNITVKNGTISGFFVGVNLVDTVAQSREDYSQSNNKIIGLTIKDCINSGFILGGRDCRVDDTVISRIGLDGADDKRAYGGQFFGPNAVFNNSRVSEISGGSESVGVSFTGRLQTGSVVSNSIFDGRLVSGQSFGIWNSSNDTIKVLKSNLHDWDFAVGGASAVSYGNSTFANNVNDFGYAAGGAKPLDNLSTFIPLTHYEPDDDPIIGDSTGGRYYGSQQGDFIAGLQGHDHIVGSGGKDTFAFITAPSGVDKDVILDFHPENSDKLGFDRGIYGAAAVSTNGVRLQIGANATGNLATFVEDPKTFTLYFDPDGVGGIPKIALSYLPYYILKPTDLIWLQQPFAGNAVSSLARAWSPLCCGDFNDDGNTDLIWQNAAGAMGEWFLRDGKRAGTMSLPALPGWDLLTAGDFNGDGTSDLLWQGPNGKLADWLIDSGKRSATFQLPTLKGWEFLAAADLNGNGTSDLLWENAAGVVSIWVMRDGKRAATLPLPAMKGWEFEAAGDFNGDGDADLIWQNADGIVGEWLIRDYARAATMTLPAMKGWDVIAAADFNGDGTDDLLWQDNAGGSLLAWIMKSGKPVDALYYGSGAGLELLAAGDIDGDARAELVWRNLQTTKIDYWNV